MTARRSFALAVAAAGGCAWQPQPVPVATYDFGPLPASATPRVVPPGAWSVDVQAPPWLDTPALLYRLAYLDAAQLRSYGYSRWAGRPADLVGARLRGRLAAVESVALPGPGWRDLTLQVELEEFGQVFDRIDASRGVVRARARLVENGRRAPLGQRIFTAERPAATPDAAGAVAALVAASDDLIDALLGWAAAVAAR